MVSLAIGPIHLLGSSSSEFSPFSCPQTRLLELWVSHSCPSTGPLRFPCVHDRTDAVSQATGRAPVPRHPQGDSKLGNELGWPAPVSQQRTQHFPHDPHDEDAQHRPRLRPSAPGSCTATLRDSRCHGDQPEFCRMTLRQWPTSWTLRSRLSQPRPQWRVRSLLGLLISVRFIGSSTRW